MKRWGAIVLAAAMLATTACGGQKTESQTKVEDTTGGTQKSASEDSKADFDGEIKIGVLTTGTAIATYTETVTNGANLAANQLNAKGGVLGKKVVIVTSDGSNTADETINGANRLLEDKDMVAVCGYPLSTGCLAIESLFKSAEKPLVISGTSVRLKDETDNEYLFRGRASDAIQARNAAAFLAEELGNDQVMGILYENNDFGQGALQVVEEYCEEKGITLVPEGFNPTDTDITTQVLKLKDAGCQSVVTWIAASSVPTVSSNMYNQGLDVPKCGPVAVTLEENLSNCEPQWIDGWYGVTDICMTKEDAALQTFIDEYYKTFGDDAYLSNEGANIYSHVLWICDAIERAESVDGPAVAEAMRNTDNFPGLNGKYKLVGDRVDYVATIDIAQDKVVDGKVTNQFIKTVGEN
ncbi:MAG: ABC transporter substrate-binding protein [Clostridia bacterium]|nr:ABC transporter substrate-binding protein [Clostridia bacterium]